MLLPLLGMSQSPVKANYKSATESIAPFLGELNKSSDWFFLNGKEQPEVDVQFAQDGCNYFINMAFTPQFFPKNSKGYNKPDLINPNSLQVKFDNGEVVSYDFDSTQSKVSYNYNTYGDGLTRYYPVYKISKQQLEQLTRQNIAKVRVNYNNGYYAITNASPYSQHQVRVNAGSMLHTGSI